MLIARSVHPLPGEAERKARLLSLIDGFGGRRVLVVGDLIADEFIYGEVHRVSREAPVLILKYDATEIVAGGAGNAASKDRKSTRLNSSHITISYAVFCLKKKKKKET